MRIWGRAEARQAIDEHERAEVTAWLHEVVAAVGRTALIVTLREPHHDPRPVAEVA
jgi:ABC-type sulfate/molybdate transport systems ATPase subunit